MYLTETRRGKYTRFRRNNKRARIRMVETRQTPAIQQRRQPMTQSLMSSRNIKKFEANMLRSRKKNYTRNGQSQQTMVDMRK